MTKVRMGSAPGRAAVRGTRSWRSAGLVVCAATCALIAGCSSGAGSAAKSLNPATAIQLTADETQNVTSLAGNVSFQTGGINASGTFQFQLKPSLVVEESLNASMSGQTVNVDEIFSGTALYLKVPRLSASSKPWYEVQLSGLSGSAAAALNELIQNAENSDPLTQLQELTASKDARQVGTQVIAGVQTTQYAGTINPSAALAKLQPILRQYLAPALSQLQGSINWNVWTDAQHNLRKLTESDTAAGSTFSLTLTVASINQPVTVTLPPASQVSILPPSVVKSGDFSLAG
jgi:hypothetical protein